MLFTVNNPKYTTRKENKNYLLKKILGVYPDFEIKVDN